MLEGNIHLIIRVRMRDEKNKGLELWLKDRSRALDERFHQNVFEYIERPLTQTQGHTIRFYKTFLYIERARKQTLNQCIETLYRWIQHWLILRCNSGTGTLLCNLNLSSSKCGIVNILHTKIRAAFGIFLQKTHILINISFILLLEILKIK